MKKIMIVTCLLLISFINSYGQWYVKKYNVTDINLLSKEQLGESLEASKKSLLAAGIIAGIGGVTVISGKYLPYEPNENPSFIEQLIGDEGMNNIAIVLGAGILAGGTIASLVYLGRIARIKSVINKNYPSAGSLNISPAIRLNSYTRSYCPGLTLTYNF